MSKSNLCLRLDSRLRSAVESTAKRLRRSPQEVIRLLLTRELIWSESGVAPTAPFFEEGYRLPGFERDAESLVCGECVVHLTPPVFRVEEGSTLFYEGEDWGECRAIALGLVSARRA